MMRLAVGLRVSDDGTAWLLDEEARELIVWIPSDMFPRNLADLERKNSLAAISKAY